MMRFRITTLLFILMLTMFTMRLGDLAVALVTGQKPELKASQAFAEEKTEAKPDAKPEASKAPAKEGDKKPERQEIPAKNPPGKEAAVKGVEPDPFMQEYSDEEVKVLESLAKRREQLDRRERDIDQREKLLQAAEKKVDEKVAELGKLRGQLEALTDQQQKMQAARIEQLVKIYENMKPKDAANIFNDMDFDVLLQIVDKMSERKVSPIMAAMTPDRARDISRKLAEEHGLAAGGARHGGGKSVPAEITL